MQNNTDRKTNGCGPKKQLHIFRRILFNLPISVIIYGNGTIWSKKAFQRRLRQMFNLQKLKTDILQEIFHMGTPEK